MRFLLAVLLILASSVLALAAAGASLIGSPIAVPAMILAILGIIGGCKLAVN